MTFRNRPRDWYQMDYQQQQEWEKQQRNIEDLEYDRERAREDAESARADEDRMRRSLAASRKQMQQDLEDEAEARREVQQQRNIAVSFIESKGLKEEFEAYRKEIMSREDY